MPYPSKPKEPRVVRAFFSSPFGGMEEEREELTRLYLPRLQALCGERGVKFVAVDLRWGITREAAESAQTLTICLRELDRADLFVGFYGQRYGWHAMHGGADDLLARNFELAAGRYPWVTQYTGRSLTEMEFLHGHLNQPGSLPAVICFRDKSYDDQMKDAAVRQGDDKTVKKYCAENPESTRLLLDLRKRCEKTKDQCLKLCLDYKTPTDVAKEIFEALRDHLASVLLKEDVDTRTPLQRMRAEHDAFLATRTSLYFADDSYFRRLDELHDQDRTSGASKEENEAENQKNEGQPKPAERRPAAIVVTGPRGIGRSALLCNWLQHRRQMDTDDVIIYHFVGTAKRSSGPKPLMRRLLDELLDATQSTDVTGESSTQADTASQNNEDVKARETTGSAEKGDNSTSVTSLENVPPEEKSSDQKDKEEEKGEQTKESDKNEEKEEKKENASKENEKSDEEKTEEEKKKEESLLDIIDTFKEEVKKVDASGRKVILIIDGLEKVSKGHKTHKVLYWLPTDLAGCVTLVLSCLDLDTALMEEMVSGRHFQSLTVQPLARDTQGQLCVSTLKDSGKELSAKQLESIVEAPQTENPLFLTTMLHELSVFGKFRQLDQKISSLLECKGVLELFHCSMQRLEEDYNTKEFPNLVQKVFSAISLSQSGLTEEELGEMFGIPSHVWSPLYFAMDRFIIVLRSADNQGFIRFLFTEMDDVVEERYLKDDEFRIKIMHDMIKFFEKEKQTFMPWKGGSHGSCQRAAEELLPLFKSLDDKEGFIRTITHLGIFSKIYDKSNGEYDLLELWAWTSLAWGQIVDLYFQAFDEALVESYLHFESLPPDSWGTTPGYSMRGFIQRVNHIVDLGGGNLEAKEKTLLRSIDIYEGAKGKVDEKKRYENLQSSKYDLACSYVDDERFQEAEALHWEIFEERRRLREESPEDKDILEAYAFSCNGLGLLYYRRNELVKGMEYLEMSLKVHEKLKNKKHMADNYCNMGLVALQEKNLSLAKEYMEKSVELYKEANFGRNTHNLGNAMTNLGLVYRRMQKLDEAERMYIRAVEIKKNAVGEFNPIVATCWMNLGTVAIHRKDPVKMEEYTRKALYILELNDAPEDSRTRWMCTENLLMSLVKQGRTEEGLQMFNDLHAIMLRKDKIDECLPFVHTTYVTYFLEKDLYEDAERVLLPLLRSSKKKVKNFLQLAALETERPPSKPRPHELTLDYGLELYPDHEDLWNVYATTKFIYKHDKEGLLQFLESRKSDFQTASRYTTLAKECLEETPPYPDEALAILHWGVEALTQPATRDEILVALFDTCIQLKRFSEALAYAERLAESTAASPSPSPSPSLLLKAATVALHCQKPGLAQSLCGSILDQLADTHPISLQAVSLLRDSGLEPTRASEEIKEKESDSRPDNCDTAASETEDCDKPTAGTES